MIGYAASPSGNKGMKWRGGVLPLIGMIVLMLVVRPVMARDAAFVDPGSAVNTVNGVDAVKVEPKAEIDIGDSQVNVSRRTTLFFTNQTTATIVIEKLAVSADSNVTVEIANDDCSKQGSLLPANRCSVDIVITPTGAGTWSVETLMTHNGAGRIARAKISGKTTGAASLEKHDQGLSLNTKDSKPVDFGEVNVGDGKTVRSALMINDSMTPITLYSIDVIEADNGLQRLDQGCAVDMELKGGESCPVTLVWAPTKRGRISTDLIIRHSGQLGFAVIPLRGTAKSDTPTTADTDRGSTTKETKADTGKGASVTPPAASADMSHAGDKPSVAAGASTASSTSASGAMHLIGTIGNRAVLYKPDGTTGVVQTGDELVMDTHTAKILSISAKSVSILYDGKPKTLVLEAARELTDKAAAAPASSKSIAVNASALAPPPAAAMEAARAATTERMTATPSSAGGAR